MKIRRCKELQTKKKKINENGRKEKKKMGGMKERTKMEGRTV
jgi:hypothetical protein